jgi:large subunit ribosomal protein L19
MEAGGSFTVRATIAGVGVEKGFPIYSPSISKVEVISSPKKVHRAKLYYVRDLSKRNIRRKTSISKEASMATDKEVMAKSEEVAK